MYDKLFHTADVIVEKGDKIVVLVRGQDPYRGKLEIIGGHVKENETVEEAALRETEEESNLKVRLKEILGVYSGPKRDPRGPTLTTVFIAEPISGDLKAGSDATDAKWVSIDKINFDKFAFDHGKILQDYLKWKKSKGTFWSTK